MATVAPAYGKDSTLRIGATSTTTVITNLTSNGISKNRDTRDVTSKLSGDWREMRPTYKGGEISFEGIYTEEGVSVNGYADLDGWWSAGTEIFWEYGSGVSGSRKESGKGYITSLERDDPQDGNTTFSGTIVITGEITVASYT